jgi:hypothetical protein
MHPRMVAGETENMSLVCLGVGGEEGENGDEKSWKLI